MTWSWVMEKASKCKVNVLTVQLKNLEDTTVLLWFSDWIIPNSDLTYIYFHWNKNEVDVTLEKYKTVQYRKPTCLIQLHHGGNQFVRIQDT